MTLDAESRRRGLTSPPPARAGASSCHLLVVGAGPAGLVAAVGAAGLGARVVLAEERLLGGDCLHSGCVPSKALLHLARRHGSAMGVVEAFSKVRERRAAMSEADSAVKFQSMGIVVLGGRMRFTGPGSAMVGAHEVRFRKAIIVTGSGPFIPGIPGLDSVPYLTTETIWQLPENPGRVLVLGGGPVGCELSQALAVLGCPVTLAHHGERLLPRDDAEAGEAMAGALAACGVTVRLGIAVRSIARDAGGMVIAATDFGPILADTLLLAAGRRANLDGLDLKAAGIATMADGPSVPGCDGIRVDGYLRTTNESVFAAGDVVAGAPRFTHASDAMARLAVRNALVAKPWPFGLLLGSTWQANLVPWCIWTDPEVAGVGEPGPVLHRIDLQANDRHALEESGPGWLKVWTDQKGLLTGASIYGRGAGELIGTMALALRERWPLRRLSGWITPYPSRSQALSRAGDAAARSALTPTVAKWLKWWMGNTSP
ncbi:MAG: dihydrolipoyl dehydrogenase family protein [Planctomycetota bacterium]